MHERSVAEDLVRAAAVAAMGEGRSVQAMHVRIGGLSCISSEALRDQVAWWSRGTIVEGAEIFVETAPTDLDDRHGADVRLVSVEIGT